MIRIESLLSARQFVSPRLADGRIYFVGNASGRMSLYVMDDTGGVPEPLLPPHIALQNPTLMPGPLYYVLPKLDLILIMLDQDGDERYQPMRVPLAGGYPEPVFGDRFAGYRVSIAEVDPEQAVVYFMTEAQDRPLFAAYRADMTNNELTLLHEAKYGSFVAGHSPDHRQVVLLEAYGAGDHVAWLWQEGEAALRRLYGVPLTERQPGQVVPPNSFSQSFFVEDGRALLFTNGIYSDTYGLARLALNRPDEAEPVTITGTVHEGMGELEGVRHLRGDRYAVEYNIDGCAWVYEGCYRAPDRVMALDRVVVGPEPLAGGVLKGLHYDRGSDRYALSFTTATSPTQIITVAGTDRSQRATLTRERVLGVPEAWLSGGEDASFVSYDGLRISARVYLPAAELGFSGPRPVVYYVHGGPTSQEHPDFAWFSMPLIQFLTLRGMAVFVPNVRGSTGYGYNYMNQVMRDWGGKDRLDHVHALTQFLPQDPRLDTSRAGVVGRSYGGYMTLSLASRHPELWSAAVDMFGPYNLLTFGERVPETWKPYLKIVLGDPEKDADFLRERSPSTYIHQVECPLLVIQGKSDPRVWEQESRELVEDLRGQGKRVDYLMFEDEGHDVIKYENRVRCYNAIVDFFAAQLGP